MGTGDLRSNELQLTARQVEVLDLLARGRTNPQIAEALGISLPGAKWHVSEVMNKLGAASREEAVAAWRAHQRLAARGSRFVRGLLPVLALKSVLLGGGAVATAAAVMVAVVALRPAGVSPETLEPPPAVAQTTPAVPQDVEQRAKELVVEVMSAYAVHVVPPASQPLPTPAPTRGPGGFRMPGRPVEAGDFVISEAQFLPAVTSVETNVAGQRRMLPAAQDVWVVRMALQPPWERGAVVEPTHLVAFDATSGELLTGGLLGELPPGGSEQDPGGPAIVARFDVGPVTFWLIDAPLLAEGPGSATPLSGPNGQGRRGCLGEVDSRLPGGLSGTCMEKEVDAALNPMESTTYNSQGFAHGWGVVAANVASIRAVTEDGREVIVTPGSVDIDGKGTRAFIAVAPGPEWFVLIEALDADGNVVDSSDTSNHPTNPPLPGTTPAPGP